MKEKESTYVYHPYKNIAIEASVEEKVSLNKQQRSFLYVLCE